ncbi:MAG: hypothetical protein CMJ64_20305 [Planctomycetaceae bacterium]|nr:hypothetical protein [Planctomycetaceae bacterium]
MECLLTLFVLMILFTVVIRSTAGGESRSSRRRSYHHLAKQFSGVYVSGGLFGSSTMRMRYGETTAFLTEASARGPYRGKCTQMQINWPDANFRAEVRMNDGRPREVTFRGLQEMKLGHGDFDRRFRLRGDDEQEVRQLLSEGVRWQIDWLAQLFAKDELYIFISSGRIFIQKPRIIRKYSELHEFVHRSLEFYDQAMITRAVGIQFVQSDRAQTLDGVICKICGEGIEIDLVFCQRCKTPHHGECWQYARSCSVYGCGETAYQRPQAAARVVTPHTSTDPPETHSESSEGMTS